MFTKILRGAYLPLVRGFATSAIRLPGNSQVVSDTRQVALRGTYLKGNFDDLPNLIFFPELCDPASNWTEFFTDPDNKFLNYRNVWLVDPRNFGNSDQHSSFDLADMADDVLRFMYSNKISTATLAGHGFGAKLATAVGCYYPERVTGIFGIDGGPLDQRYHEAFHELRENLERINSIDLRAPRTDIEVALKREIADPKWRAIFAQNLRRTGDRHFEWNFNLPYLLKNVRFNKADSVGNWVEKHGIYGGRAQFIFPEYSRWIHLNTNTLPFHRTCPQVQGYGIDIFSIQGDENPLNHWIYELEHYGFPISRKFVRFLSRYDGVHVLLKDRSEIGNYFIPDIPNSRRDPDHIHRDYSPAHLHHNWRFSTIYEDADRIEKEKIARAQAETAAISGEQNPKK
jgi:pimeloyl-ACP methyl ester carboxylesterase